MSESADKLKTPSSVKILKYKAPWTIYGLSWSERADQPFRLAVSSFTKSYHNAVEIVRLNPTTNQLERVGRFKHTYPCSKIKFMPSPSTTQSDLLATSGDFLRLFDIGPDDQVRQRAKLDGLRQSNFCSPIISFDWSRLNLNILGTACVDTTVTIWDIEKLQKEVQLVAQEGCVTDISFSPTDPSSFVTCGQDGSVRLFDRRSLEYSSVVYEGAAGNPPLRVMYNKENANYISCSFAHSSDVAVLDLRMGSAPIATISGHVDGVNGISWAPHSSCHLASVGEDGKTFIWELGSFSTPGKSVEQPLLVYDAKEKTNAVDWSFRTVDWLSIAHGRTLELLHI
eukprot:gnl/Dysnectes_brevis/3641_a4645_772.p1 GENE.gnl/Dysnectes_brevis/3641_a4645_772~~gnl/Dysnectes_brevis/3641_a4645_772.p1  ORF type:complete len:340 (-),score=87.20 gnl/Dysnectes_brevis/3641_a4645_772:53-1072(-)